MPVALGRLGTGVVEVGALLGGDSTPSNRYTTVGPQTYLYDARGNLTFDGRFIYVYDYLNRLSEVWLPVTESESEQMMASSSTSTGQRSVLRPESRRRFVVNNREALFGARRSALARVERGAAAILRMASDPLTARQLSGSIPAGTLSLQSEASATSSSQAMTDASSIPTRLAPIAFYGYDGFERRTFRLVVTNPYIFFYAYDGWQEVSEQITLDGSTATPTVQSVWGRELDELLAIRVNSEFGFTTSYVAEGGAHCPQWLVNSSGATIEQQQYDAYGATSYWVPGTPATPQAASPRQNPWGWKGHRVDPETGFVQMRHRYYSVVLGRFLTSDPLGVWGDVLGRGNSYAYAGGRPLVWSDRLGLQVTLGQVRDAAINEAIRREQAGGVEDGNGWSFIVKPIVVEEGFVVTRVDVNPIPDECGVKWQVRFHMHVRPELLAEKFLAVMNFLADWGIPPFSDARDAAEAKEAGDGIGEAKAILGFLFDRFKSGRTGGHTNDAPATSGIADGGTGSGGRHSGPYYKTSKDAKKAAEAMGYTRTGGRTKAGQAIYRKGNRYISRDVDGHGGGAWKMADSPGNLDSKDTRLGTFSPDLSQRIRD